MRKFYFAGNNISKFKILCLIISLLIYGLDSFAQPATVSVPVGEGKSCGVSNTDSVKYFNYDPNTNILTHRSNCKPTLAAPGFSSGLSSITFNAYDGYLYFSQIANVSGVYNTYTYRWPATVCPNTSTLPVYRTFPNQFVAGVEFDPATGLGYQIVFVGSYPYTMELQQVNFTTGVLGASKPVSFGSRFIYSQNGDVVMTPGGQLLAVFDNKYFTVNWKDYALGNPLVATYIDTIPQGSGNNLVGLSYSGGKLVGSIQGAVCQYKELDILTGAQSPATYSGAGTMFTSTDMTNIPSGIGAAKRLVSATENPVGSKTYDIVYEVIIKNYGGTPITNIQGYDTLNKINGLANVISGSILSITAPPGITKNATYNGKTAGNFHLLTPGSTLSNIPGQNTITLYISCKISNILPGIVYNNQAVISGTGLLGDALRDSSTNGANPDLNLNDKPDDVGESQPTPLLISVAALTPPCSTLTNVLYSQDFGSGTGLTTVVPAAVAGANVFSLTGTTFYSGSTTQPLATEKYSITNNANNGNNAYWSILTDRTGNPNGRMAVINADAANTIIYRASFTSTLCANQQYSLSFYAAFLGNNSYKTVCDAFGGFQYSRLKLRIRDGTTSLIITEVTTATINNTGWQQYGVKFISPASYTQLIFELINDAAGGCGNDLAIDDIQFGTCDALPTVAINTFAGCIGGTTTFTSDVADPAATPGPKDYQWQVSSNSGGPFTDITGETSDTYTINPLNAGDVNKYYRVIVAAQGNISNANCRYYSPENLLTGKTMSVRPASATRNKNNICAGLPVDLGITGGTLGTNASYKWYTGSCGGTLVGTGSAITVSPFVTTTFYVRAEGECNTTNCRSIVVTITCDIDKDNDGIPDYVESYMPSAIQDADTDGISNAFDLDYAGYGDNNNDHINDNFQADGDTDNDGIPNYLDVSYSGRIDTNGDAVDDRFDMDKDGIINMLDLDSDNDGIPDVVEAGGADTNGDAIIDNLTDTDNDGFSQNVDANNTGARISGLGLGLADFDNDGKPNTIDLDSDNDGISDITEVFGSDGDNNGMIDGFTDANADGLSDNVVTTSALLKTGADVTSDGRADSYPNKNFDSDSKANPYDVDSDMDGIIDVVEAGYTDADYNGFIDGPLSADGWNTALHGLPALNLRNTDGRGYPDFLDIDADDDGIPDNIEGMTTAGYQVAAYSDADGDGLDNIYDNSAAYGGAGVFVPDLDGDGIPDYRDSDTDADGLSDRAEGNDFNLNGVLDDDITLTLLDTDGDGLDNKFDSLNSVSNFKGTSYNMGGGGSPAGDATPGSRSPVQKTVATQTNRDWRFIGYVLNIQLLQFTGAMQGDHVLLNWSIITQHLLDRCEIERSTDNAVFKKVATVVKDIPLNELQSFFENDNIDNINAEVIYYRLKVIAKNGQVKYSNVIVIKKNPNNTVISILPNPASGSTTLRFFSNEEKFTNLRLIDNMGRTVLEQSVKIFSGINHLQLNDLLKLSNGVYSLQIQVNDELVTQKLVLTR